jgi:ATP-dependent protease ClpP protease subunit
MRHISALMSSYFARVHSWASAGYKALQGPRDGAQPQAREDYVYGEPDVVETEDGVEVRVYAFIESHMLCEMWGLPGSVAVSEVGFARALDKAKATGKPIRVRLNSYGGDVFAGVAIASRIREDKLPVTVDGVAASIASVMAAASPEVTMLTGSTLMLHNPWTMAAGNAKGLRAEADVLDKLRDAMLDIYTAKTGDKFTRDEWKVTLDGLDGADGTWWTGTEAVDAGMADEYDTGQPDAARSKALLDTRRMAAEVHGVALPKNLDEGQPEFATPEPETKTPGTAGPAGDDAKVKAGVRVFHRPGSFRYPK